MAKATDISAPILTGTAGTESALSGIDPYSKAAFENAVRESGDTAYVDQYVQDNPEQFLSPYELSKLQDVGPETFWNRYNGVGSGGGQAGGGNAVTDSTGGQFKATDGTLFTNYQDYQSYQDALDNKLQGRKSAYDLLFQEFSQYGLGSLVESLKDLITDTTVAPSEFSIRLQQTPAYKQRFSANADRIAKGLTALTPAEYLAKEDAYQNVMRNYGLPESYYTKGALGKQEGFDKLLANDVSATELEDRILNAQNRVLNANPEVVQALKNFYPDIKNGDILAYVLDPQNALSNIKKKITASEIGGAAMAAGLTTSVGRAEQLGAAGVTGQAYQQASPFITTAAQRGSQLADIYGQSPYGQSQAEQEAFNLSGAPEAVAQRRKLKSLEEASFAGSSGTSGGALSRDRAISNYMMGSPGAGAF